MAGRHNGQAGGYLLSALAFGGITALWAYIVRDDPYYAMTALLGLKLPVATVFYLTVMPTLGFLIGGWRYQSEDGSGLGQWIAKSIARSLHFLYTHILISLFTLAMAVDYFLGWNLDSAVKQIDDNMFDIASRFAPWLSAYLAGYNIGRFRAARAAEKELQADYGTDVFTSHADDEGVPSSITRASRHDRVRDLGEARQPISGVDLDRKPQFDRLR